jgi:Zn-dependent protease with chaperone function
MEAGGYGGAHSWAAQHARCVYCGRSNGSTYTFGSDTSAFIVLGTAILTNFQNDELLFVLAREMGHCRAGHALWKTVTRFLTGDISLHARPAFQRIVERDQPREID